MIEAADKDSEKPGMFSSYADMGRMFLLCIVGAALIVGGIVLAVWAL